ncbi:MAG: hypothetical protein ACOYN0_16005 [Phycisphaerales bacterium]
MSLAFRITVSIVVLIGMIAMPLLVPTWTTKAAVAVGWVEILCAVVLAAALSRPKTSGLMWRVLAGLIFVTFAGYLTLELVASGGKFTVSKRSQNSVLSALAGLIVIGIPCLKFALRRPAEETVEDDPEEADDSDPEEAAEADPPSGREQFDRKT